MYIILEVSPLPELCERLRQVLDPDTPMDPLVVHDKIGETLNDLFLTLLGVKERTDNVDEVFSHEDIIELAETVLLKHIGKSMFQLSGLENTILKSIKLLNKDGDLIIQLDSLQGA